jgi:hypothetical protein
LATGYADRLELAVYLAAHCEAKLREAQRLYVESGATRHAEQLTEELQP